MGEYRLVTGPSLAHVVPNACWVEYGWLDYVLWEPLEGVGNKFYVKKGVVKWRTYQCNLFS